MAAGLLLGILAMVLLRTPPQNEKLRDELARRDQVIADLRHALAGEDSKFVEIKKQMEEVQALRADYQRLAEEFDSYKRGGLGRLTYMIGTMQVAEPDAKEGFVPAWIGMPLTGHTLVRTGPGAKAAFHLADGTELRLNESTELQVAGPRQLRLDAGEVWAQVQPGKERFHVLTRDGRVEVMGTEIDVRVDPKYTVLLVFSGAASITNGKMARHVKAGEAAIADQLVVTGSTVAKMERATKWMLDLLIARGRDNPELGRQIARLLEMMGASKVEYLTEEEIKSYGSACTIPIARWLENPESGSKAAARLKAIRILSDIGDWYAVDTYIKLLSDPSPEVRPLAAKGLQRVTGQTLGYPAAFWGSGEDHRPAVQAWNDWWAKTRSTKVTDDLEQQLERVKKKFEK
jgi:ferric-dicitrate binding protein FerR (iron transport regulator)